MNRWFLITLALFFNAFANIFMKYGVKNRSVDLSGGLKSFLLSYLSNVRLITGILFFGIALVFYSKALEKFDLSVAYPLMTTTGILIVTIWSVLFFGEKLSFAQFGGIGMIIGGIWLLTSQF